ncbi:MAG: toxic anion resistance protein, partial [Lachnospiraceae bacterium]|nr:toxic anion resistance protein [Lachnospiraceae bacterium]
MGFSLDLPDVEEIKARTVEETALTTQESSAVDNLIVTQGDQILNVDLDDFSNRRDITNVINDFGKEVMVKSESKNQMMQKRLSTYGSSAELATVAKGLEDLAIQMRDLDPSGLDFVKTGALGKLFNPVRRYFEKYKSADQEIAGIIESLDKGRNTLKNDNTTLEIEEVNMRNLTKELNVKIATGEQLDAYLTGKIEEAAANGADPDKIKFINEEVLFPLRQRIIDFQSLLAVNQQGIIAIEVVRKNNNELMRSVDRAKTVTVASLRTAVMVASALYDQKIVLEKVSKLNETTNNMILATSKMLKEQGVEIQKQATEAGVSVETLKQAFSDTFAALEDISNFKQQALPLMRNTISE